MKQRCAWCGEDPLYVAYHDEEWGVPLRDEQALFEFLVLEGAQAGLSWITVLRKRENYRRAMDNFDPEKIARYDENKLNQLLGDTGIIRNRRKLSSAVQNARACLALQQAGTSLGEHLWQFVDGRPETHFYQSTNEVPAATATSDKLSKSLKALGFNFVGSTICYALMQATGMVNDHLVSCYRHADCRKMAP